MYALKPTTTVTVEELIFSGMDLVASVGGYLGLYLGASILSFYHLGVDLFKRIKKY